MPTPLRFLLPLCLLVACLASAPPLPASPGGAPRQEDALREWVETRLQHLERRLLLQEESALATAKQERRLLELETEVQRLRKEREAWIKDAQNLIIAAAEKKKEEVRETGDRYVSMAGSGFTALGVLMAIIALVPIFFAIANTVSFNESAKQKLREIDRLKYDAQKIAEDFRKEIQCEMACEVKTYIEDIKREGNKAKKELNTILLESKKAQQEIEDVKKNVRDSVEGWSRGKEISQSTIDDANELIRQGKGVDVLWGYAILAMQKEAWREACQYWEDILLQTPDDAAARFNLTQCQIFWACSDTVTPLERQELFEKAEIYYTDMLKNKQIFFHKNKVGILMLYARIKRFQASYATEFQSRNSLRENAEKLLWEAKSLAPQNADILWLLSDLKREQANDPQNRDPETRLKLRNAAEDLLQEAKAIAPQDAATLFQLSALRLEQAQDATQEDRTRLLDEAEDFLKELTPQDAPSALYDRACIAALRGQPEKALGFLEQSRKAGTLPFRRYIEKDKALDSLRQREDFKAFLQRAWPSQKP